MSLNSILDRLAGQPVTQRRKKQRRTVRFTVEALERRLLLTGFLFPTAITVAASQDQVNYAQAVTLTANVTASPTAPSEGTVSFLDNGALLGSGSVTSGTATLSNLVLPAGSHHITASFSDSLGNYGPSSTASLITTVAGDGTAGFAGDNGAATSAEFSNLLGIAVDPVGDLFITDTNNNRIREVDHATGVITTVAGNGTPDFAGDNGLATAAELQFPEGIAVDAAGDLFIADTSNNRIREVDHATGVITTVAGNGNAGVAGDKGPATSAELFFPEDIAVDAAGDLFIADSGNDRIREVDHATGVITTVAGDGTAGFLGDNGPTAAAELNIPSRVAVDAAGDLIIADSANNRIREVANGVTVTVTPATLTVTADNKTMVYGATVPALTDTITGFVNGDTSSVVSGTAALSTTATTTSPVGSYPIVVGQGTLSAADYTFKFVNGTLTVTASAAVVVLDATSKGSVTVTGNGNVQVTGNAEVLSKSQQAVVASGNATVSATEIDIEGSPGTSLSGNAKIQGKVVAGLTPVQDPALSDPFSALPVPAQPTATFAAASYSGNTTATLKPGTYVGGISVSGKAAVTLLPGLFYLKGGGLSVSGGGSVTGNGVVIYNAPQNGTGAISVTGQGTITLTAPTSGTYQGVGLFQDRSASAPITVSGNGSLDVTGSIYAAAATLNISGNGKTQVYASGDVVVDDLNVSGNGLLIDGSKNSASGDEFQHDTVAAIYQQYLGRAPDAGGLAYWSAYLYGGGTIEGMSQALVSSPEYWQTRAVGTADGFVSALFNDALGRAIDPAALTYFEGLMAQGATAADIAASVFNSDEYHRIRVDALFEQFMDRTADAGAVAYFASELDNGGTDELVIAQLLASDEYFAKAQL